MSTARKESRVASFQALLPKSFVVNPLRVLENRFSLAETMDTETVCRKSTFKDDNDVFSTLNNLEANWWLSIAPLDETRPLAYTHG